jgi:putative endopeptidase
MWRGRYSEKVEKTYFENDNHPLAYLRANVTVMQFEEFVETFNVQPGDGMYLEPEKRIAIW